MRSSGITVLTFILGTSLAQTQKFTKAFIPSSFTYLLSEPFKDNTTARFIETQSSNATANAIFDKAHNATCYYYDKDFEAILGRNPTICVIESRNTSFAYEAGSWAPDFNQVYFTSSIASRPTYVSILDLASNTITTPNISISQGANLNGGIYFNGLQYFTVAGNESLNLAPGIVSLDPKTLSSRTVIDSFFGVNLNSIDDMTWVKPNLTTGATACTHNETNMFFSSVDFTPYGSTGLSVAVMANAVWRFTPETQSLQAVISRADVLVPNGVASDASGRYLYITDTSAPVTAAGPGVATFGAGDKSSGSSAIYRYELDADCNPGNKQLFAMIRSGIADGIHVDDFGRVWTGESPGIVVRNSRGKVLGVFNAAELLNEDEAPVANFAIAGDKLVVLAFDRVLIIQLGQNVTTPARYKLNQF